MCKYRTYNCILVSTLFSFLLIVVIINISIDPGTIYFRKFKPDLYEAYIDELISSKHGLNQLGWNERSTKLALAKKSHQFQCVVMGSSRVTSISTYKTPSIFASYCDSMINLGVSGGTIEDIVIFTNVIQSKKPYPKRIIIGIDHWMLQFGGDGRWRANQKLFDNSLIKIHKPVNYLVDKKSNNEWLINILNYDYFYQSIIYLKKNGIKDIYEEYLNRINQNKDYKKIVSKSIIKNFDYNVGFETPVTLPDGSHIYSKMYIKNSMEKKHIFDDTKYKINKGEWYDHQVLLLINKLVKIVKSKGIDVDFLFVPYHHNIWEKKSGEITIKRLKKVESFIRSIGLENDVDVLGSYNPQDISCKNNEFYDYMHPHSTCLNKIFSTYLQRN